MFLIASPDADFISEQTINVDGRVMDDVVCHPRAEDEIGARCA